MLRIIVPLLAAAAAAGTAGCARHEPLRAGSAAGEQAIAPQALLHAVVGSLGGAAAVEAARDFHAEHQGSFYALEQGISPDRPELEVARSYHWAFDSSNRRMIREAEQAFPAGIRFSTRAALTDQGGWIIDLLRWRSGIDLAPVAPAEAVRSMAQFERFFPHLLARQAGLAPDLERGGDLLRYTDAGGQMIQVEVDPSTRLPSSAVLLVNGQPQTEWIYADYQLRNGVRMPLQVEVRQAGRLQESLRLGQVRLGAPDAAAFGPPPGYAAPPPASPPLVREIAPELFLFEGLPGGYRSLALDAGDHIVLMEAPLNAEYAAIQRRLLAEAKPDKPVRYVLVTHYHGDHTGGLKAWHDVGATIVVAAGSRVAIERQLRARGVEGGLRIEEVEERRSFGSGTARVDVYAFASSHAAANLLMHVPAHRVLLHGDMYSVPERGEVPPAGLLGRELARQIDERRLGVDLIIAVHGRPATNAEFRRALLLAPQAPAP